PELVEQEQKAEAAVAKNKVDRKFVICISAAILAVVMIVLAIFIPIWTAETVNHQTFLNWKNFNPNDPDNPYNSENPNPNPTPNPIVTVTLTGDDEDAFVDIFGQKKVSITVEIFMDDAPYAGMNFMYLAESGFYNNTIISDLHRGKALFCGFTDTTNDKSNARDGSVLRNLKGFVENTSSTWNNLKFKLGYRLTAESKRSVLDTSQSALGYLIMMSGSSTYYATSTAFMFTTREDPQLNFADDNTSVTSYTSWLGRVTDDESMQVLTKLDTVTSTLNGKSYCPDTTIRISSIKTNLSSAKKKYLLENFESLIHDGLSVSTWRTVAYNENYYGFNN
ncbi:MAG: peptidylprolyl isomerase, partial [Clostridia bacterium]|nr:peptidylprolyl isomerase [Clostridia bacterium]